MKAKNEIILEIEKEDRVYQMSMPINAPLGESYEAAAAFLDEIIRLIKEHADKRIKVELEESEEKPEEVKEEEK